MVGVIAGRNEVIAVGNLVRFVDLFLLVGFSDSVLAGFAQYVFR